MKIDYDDPDGHILMASFGVRDTDEMTKLDHQVMTLPAIGSIITELATRVTYDETYGIFDHTKHSHERPLALVGYHPKEDLIEGGMYFTLIREYKQYKIKDHFGYNLTEWMDLPKHIADFLIELADGYNKQSEKEKTKEHNEFDRQIKKTL